MLKVLVLCVVVQVVIKMRVIDGIHINMVVGSGKGSPKEGVVLLDICSMGGVKIFRLIARLGDGQSLSGPVDGGVCSAKPRKS